jgi:Na+-translocating ferredoxin:NAD+ oxidoreductase RnfG subunit
MRRVHGLLLLLLFAAVPARAQEGQFLSEAEAPKAVFPDADTVTRTETVATPALREQVDARLNGTRTSVWESQWVVFRAQRGATLLGHALVVEEIGKHQPITFVVGLRPDGRVADVAVMAYREAYGGEIRNARFLAQYHDKGPGDAVRPYRDIRNVAGATLSVEAASRAVKKAQALAAALGFTT